MMWCFKKKQGKIYRKKRRVDSKMCKAIFPLYSEMAGSQPEHNRRRLSNGDEKRKLMAVLQNMR